MKTARQSLLRPGSGKPGYALLLVLIFSGVSLTLVAAALRWASNNALMTQRNNFFASNNSVAEVATQKVISKISQDYQTNGEAYIYSNLGTYRSMVPNAAESSVWGSYVFSDAQGNNYKTYVNRLVPWRFGDLTTKYSGLKGFGATYRIVSNARMTTGPFSNLVSGVRQDIQLASIPIFQYAAFYGIDLEIGAGFDFAINGPVHCNENVYLSPNRSVLTFLSHLTSGKSIVLGKKPANPVASTQGTVVFRGERDSGVRSFNLPIGMANTSTNLRQLVELPPSGESRATALSAQRYYNKADLIILVSNTTAVAFSGAYNNFAIRIPITNLFDYSLVVTNHNNRGRGRGRGGGSVDYTTNNYDGMISTNQAFFDKRENRTVLATEMDISELNDAMPYLVRTLGVQPKLIYIADYRSASPSTFCAIRLVNGSLLPSGGLTIATPNPIYIRGHYNVDVSEIGTTSTTRSRPASVVSDAVTILSPGWFDQNSSASLSQRRATSTTINCGFITGVVQTGGGYYGGG